MKVAIYARYSSDNQRDASIADQLRICREFAAREGWTVVQEFTDHAISGATLLRSGFQALMRDALNRRFDVVLAESLDRFSRDQEDTAGLFKRLTFAGVSIVTLAEGDITHLHIGFKGTMNALFLKDLAQKTHRGLRGRVESGKVGGGLCYGYRVVKSLAGGTLTTGEREIEPGEAAIVDRIFREYVAGIAPKSTAKRLNHDRIAGPVGGTWSPSTIHGNSKRGTGILNNELYIGRLIWNRLRYVKNPDTGKRISRLNPNAEWITKEIPFLRIVSDELWNAAKDRQSVTRRTITRAGNIGFARRPLYLFSGLSKCGVCGAGFIMAGRNRLACFGAREKGTCSNRLTIRRDEVEARVLKALQDKLLNQELFEEFCDEFTREMNRLRMEHRAGLSAAEHEIGRIEARRKRLIEMVMEGVAPSVVKDELNANAARREQLGAQLAATEEPPPPLLHPEMARIYRSKVTELAKALREPDSRSEATEALRGLVDAIVLTPDQAGETLQIELRGNLAAMLGATVQSKRSPETGDLSLQVSMVAGPATRCHGPTGRPISRPAPAHSPSRFGASRRSPAHRHSRASRTPARPPAHRPTRRACRPSRGAA
jgi:site-specific DNA recombinase